jgi:hypothetical protein
MRNSGLWIVTALMVVSLHAAASQTTGGNKDEQEIRALEDRFAAAFRVKDVDSIMKNYGTVQEALSIGIYCRGALPCEGFWYDGTIPPIRTDSTGFGADRL